MILLAELLSIALHPVIVLSALAVGVLVEPSFLKLFAWAAIPTAALAAYLYLGDGELRMLGTNASSEPSEFGWAGGYIASLTWIGLAMIAKALFVRSRRKKAA